MDAWLLADRLDDSDPVVIDAGQVVRRGRLRGWADALAAALAGLCNRRVALAGGPLAPYLAALAALERVAAEALLLPEADAAASAERARAAHAVALIEPAAGGPRVTWLRDAPPGAMARVARVAASDPPPDVRPNAGLEAAGSRGTVVLLTSGTSGAPKAVQHTWQSLARPVRPGRAGARWLLAYPPNLYAGLQVILQCLHSGGVLIAPPARAGAEQIAALAAAHAAQFASATPSWWRRLLALADRETLAQIPLEQVTLGGEVVDAGILEALGAAFPRARLVHIYATSELGRCFAVRDGRPGFPVEYVGRPLPGGVELRVCDGELCARSGSAMRRYVHDGGAAVTHDGFWRTGDLVERVGDRYEFVGRKSEMINVGGAKVHPLEVERVVRAVPGVGDARVYARRSSVAGQLVACDLVPGDGADPDGLIAAVHAACQRSLAGYQRPRFVRAVARIELTGAGKAARGVVG